MDFAEVKLVTIIKKKAQILDVLGLGINSYSSST